MVPLDSRWRIWPQQQISNALDSLPLPWLTWCCPCCPHFFLGWVPPNLLCLLNSFLCLWDPIQDLACAIFRRFSEVCSVHLHFLTAISRVMGSYLAHARRPLFLIFSGNWVFTDLLQAAVDKDLQLAGLHVDIACSYWMTGRKALTTNFGRCLWSSRETRHDKFFISEGSE